MFLNKEDLTAQVYPELTARLSRTNDEVVLIHLKTAEREIETHLAARYNIRPELEKQGDDRDDMLVLIGRSLAIWHLYQNVETIPDKVDKAYDRAAELLKMLAKGTIILPGVEAPEVVISGANTVEYGTNVHHRRY